MTLVCAILAGASHLRGPSHSPRFLLGLLILTFPTLLITLLAFLVDILLFIPNLAWGGWIVLAATLIITACSVLTCAMRRTLVSRKARKRRIAENADMNGENFYAMKQAQSFARAESPPPAMVEPETANKFAVFDHTSGRMSTDDRTPLNAQAPSIRTLSTSGPSGSQANGTPRPQNTNLSGSTAVLAATEQEIISQPNMDYPIGGTPHGTISPSENERMHDNQGQDNRNRSGVYPPYRGGPPPRGASSRGTPPVYPPGRGGYPPSRPGPPPRGGIRGGYGSGPQGYPSRGSFGPGQRGSPSRGWNGRGRGMPGRGGSGTPGPYIRSPPTSPREYDSRGMSPFGAGHAAPPVIYDATYTPNKVDAQRIPQTRYRTPERAQEDDAVAVIDAYNNVSRDIPVNSSFARDPASFGFSGRQSPGRGTRAPPRPFPDTPPVPGHNVSELTAEVPAELDSARTADVPGVVSELDTYDHSSAPTGPG